VFADAEEFFAALKDFFQLFQAFTSFYFYHNTRFKWLNLFL
jgi:hypothetical protein